MGNVTGLPLSLLITYADRQEAGTAEKYQFLKSLIRSVGRMKKWKKDDEEELKFAEADDRQTL